LASFRDMIMNLDMKVLRDRDAYMFMNITEPELMRMRNIKVMKAQNNKSVIMPPGTPEIKLSFECLSGFKSTVEANVMSVVRFVNNSSILDEEARLLAYTASNMTENDSTDEDESPFMSTLTSMTASTTDSMSI
jgi:hypothetical protein